MKQAKKGLFILFAIFSMQAFSQSPIQPGETQANFGVGLDSEGIPIYGGIDYGMWDDVSLGAQVGFASEYFTIGGNINYHFDRVLTLPSEWNVYGGGNLGAYFLDDANSDSKSSDLGIGAQLGTRYFFNEKWAANLEFAGGNQVSGAKLGLTVKF